MGHTTSARSLVSVSVAGRASHLIIVGHRSHMEEGIMFY